MSWDSVENIDNYNPKIELPFLLIMTSLWFMRWIYWDSIVEPMVNGYSCNFHFTDPHLILTQNIAI